MCDMQRRQATEAECGPVWSHRLGPQAAHAGAPPQVGLGTNTSTDQPTALVFPNQHLKVSQGPSQTTGNCPGADKGVIPSKWDPHPRPHPRPRAQVQDRGCSVVLVPPAEPGVRAGVCTGPGATRRATPVDHTPQGPPTQASGDLSCLRLRLQPGQQGQHTRS